MQIREKMNKDEYFTCAVFLPPLVTMLSELVGYWNAWIKIAFQISVFFWMVWILDGTLHQIATSFGDLENLQKFIQFVAVGPA